MDQFGSVNLRWSIGYNGSPIFFTNNKTIAHLAGNCIRLFNIESGEEKFIRSPGDGIRVFAVNTSYNLIALSESCIDTNIFIYDLDDTSEPKAVLQGAGTLGVSALAFANNGSLLASYAQAPDCSLTLWNWPEQRRLCSKKVSGFTCTQLSFNPVNWRQLCGISDDHVVLWTTEEVNQSYHIASNKVRLPPVDGGYEADLFDDLDRQISRSVSPIASNIKITKTAIAGIIGDEIDSIELGDKRKRCSPKGHCWAQSGQIYCCCSGGQILAVNFESLHVAVLYNPVIYDNAVEGIMHENEPDERLENPLSELVAGSMECIALHQKGLFTAGLDGSLRCIDLSKTDLEISERIPLEHSTSSICWSPEYDCLVLGSEEGCISMYHTGDPGTKKLFEGHSGEIIGLDCTKDSASNCVTCKENGLLQLWSIAKPVCIGQLNLQCKATAMRCLASSSTLVVGTADGRLLLVDVSSTDKPRLVLERFLHKGPITALGICNMGKVIVTGSTDERVFIIDARVTSDFNVFGYTKIEGEARSISCLHCVDDKNMSLWKILIGVGHADDTLCFSRLVGLDITSDTLKGGKGSFVDRTGLFRDSAIMKRNYLFRNAMSSICAVSRQNAFAIQLQGKKLAKLLIPVSEENTGNLVLDPLMDAQGHGLEGGCIAASSHLKWLASGAPDGKLILRATGALDNLVTVTAGHRLSNGIINVCFTNDSRNTLTVGGDGTLSCWGWEFSTLGKSRAAAAVDAAKAQIDALHDMRLEQDRALTALAEISIDHQSSGISTSGTPTCEEKTWLDLSVAKAHEEEDMKYKENKSKLRQDIASLRKQVLDMIDVNGRLPDIEKLDRHEFNMDLEERMKLLNVREGKLKELRSEIEYKNLAKQYVRDLIKRQCWDEMSTKGRSLKAFNSTTEVTNYPMRERTKAETDELEFVTKQRRLEIMEDDIRKETLDAQAATNPPLVEEHNLDEEESSEDDRRRKETPAVTGSLSTLYGGDNELLRSQFAIYTSQEKRHQIVLLEDCIYQMKVAFNKNFSDVFKMKESEIKKITDRNVRIRKILKDLGAGDAVFEPSWTVDEKPEMLLEVKDEEVTVEKYISEEEQKKLDALAQEEEERKKAEKADNARERALGMMMAGRLEANLEEELKKELVKPEFMEKPSSEWTDEEQKAAKEFEKKEQKLKEEREKFRKALEAELKKLQNSVTEATSNFDERLAQLFNRKIKTEMVICQEELKIQRMAASLLMEEELDTREAQLLQILEEKKVAKQESSTMVGDVKREVDASKDSYEIISAEDKTLDKNFRREFADQDQHTVEVLYRLFKRRPRAQKTLKAAVETQADVPASGGNPFKPRPSSSRAVSVAVATLEKAMTELDDDQHMPEGVDHETWRRLVMLRRFKVEKEQQVKSKALVLADLNSIHQKRIEDDERLKLEIEHVFKELQRLRDDRLRFNLNLEVQLLLKQGQVELPSSSFINDYGDSILIHRSVVEDFNATIKTLGESKLASMKDSKEFRKGIYQLEWEHKKMHMQAEDLKTAARDIQLLRVTKDLQAYLGEGDQTSRQQHEVVTLEKTVELHQKMHQRNVKDRMNGLKTLKRLIKKKEAENESLDENLEELSLSVAERRNINHPNDDERNDTAAAKRMQDIITRRKLVDLAKAQAQEIAVLRAEVERLRMRTFPALVQVDQR